MHGEIGHPGPDQVQTHMVHQIGDQEGEHAGLNTGEDERGRGQPLQGGMRGQQAQLLPDTMNRQAAARLVVIIGLGAQGLNQDCGGDAQDGGHHQRLPPAAAQNDQGHDDPGQKAAKGRAALLYGKYQRQLFWFCNAGQDVRGARRVRAIAKAQHHAAGQTRVRIPDVLAARLQAERTMPTCITLRAPKRLVRAPMTRETGMAPRKTRAVYRPTWLG